MAGGEVSRCGGIGWSHGGLVWRSVRGSWRVSVCDVADWLHSGVAMAMAMAVGLGWLADICPVRDGSVASRRDEGSVVAPPRVARSRNISLASPVRGTVLALAAFTGVHNVDIHMDASMPSS